VKNEILKVFVIFRWASVPAGQVPRIMLIISVNTKPLCFKYSLLETKKQMCSGIIQMKSPADVV
jgi:hypothetical protein